jgi:transposase
MDNDIKILGIDLGKNWFHLSGLDKHGKCVYRKKLNRKQMAELAQTIPACLVAMESCPGSQFWGRRFAEAGHDIRIIPGQFVKPFLKGGKNDFNDSLAIAEASGRPNMHCVGLKSQEQLELQAIHRVRCRLITERTAIINQMRALLLEHGIVCAVGRKLFERKLPEILEDAENGLSFRLRALIDHLRSRWRVLDVEVDEMTALLTAHSRESETCQRICDIPGVGPIVASAMIAAVGNASAFKTGRDMAAWLGLVPRQHTTGGKPKLGSITKRGNVQLRTMVVQGAKSLLIHMDRESTAIGIWLGQLEKRVHRHVAVIALANKITRICWKLLSTGETYAARQIAI